MSRPNRGEPFSYQLACCTPQCRDLQWKTICQSRASHEVDLTQRHRQPPPAQNPSTAIAQTAAVAAVSHDADTAGVVPTRTAHVPRPQRWRCIAAVAQGSNGHMPATTSGSRCPRCCFRAHGWAVTRRRRPTGRYTAACTWWKQAARASRPFVILSTTTRRSCVMFPRRTCTPPARCTSVQ